MAALVPQSNSQGIIEVSLLSQWCMSSAVLSYLSLVSAALCLASPRLTLHMCSPAVGQGLVDNQLRLLGPLLVALSSPVFVLQFPAASPALNCRLCLLSAAWLLFYVSLPCAALKTWSPGWHSGLILMCTWELCFYAVVQCLKSSFQVFCPLL